MQKTATRSAAARLRARRLPALNSGRDEPTSADLGIDPGISCRIAILAMTR